MKNILVDCRRSFGYPPRKISAFELWRLKMPVPSWARSSGDRRFTEFFQHQSNILKTGQIVWGKIIQANELLFEHGRDDHPAAIIYSLNSRIDARPEILENAASELFSVKGTYTKNRELQIFSDKLDDEMVVDLKLGVPLVLTEGIQCFYSSIMIHRKHMPDRKLSCGFFPILANAEKTDATMILPSKYWPSEFVELWKSEE